MNDYTLNDLLKLFCFLSNFDSIFSILNGLYVLPNTIKRRSFLENYTIFFYTMMSQERVHTEHLSIPVALSRFCEYLNFAFTK